MSKRSDEVARLIAANFPQMTVRQVPFDDRAKPIDVIDGPVVTVAEGVARGIAVAIHGLDCDNLDRLSDDLCKQVLSRSIDLGIDDGMQETLYLNVAHRDAIHDEADYRIGQVIDCIAIECSEAIASADAA